MSDWTWLALYLVGWFAAMVYASSEPAWAVRTWRQIVRPVRWIRRRLPAKHVKTDPAYAYHRLPRTWWQRWRFDRGRGRSCPMCVAKPRMAAGGIIGVPSVPTYPPGMVAYVDAPGFHHRAAFDGERWTALDLREHWIFARDVESVRPLVVIDPQRVSVSAVALAIAIKLGDAGHRGRFMAHASAVLDHFGIGSPRADGQNPRG